MNLTEHQQEAVGKLLGSATSLLAKDGSRACVFKAPTGSGKTIMTAEFLRQLCDVALPGRYAFLWIASNDLHKQSKEKLSIYLADTRYSFQLLDEVASDGFEENQITFVNWESLTRQDRATGEFRNVLMRDNEGGRNLPSFIANTKAAGLDIILVVDESHYRYWSPKSQSLVQDIIAPKLTLEVSATPAIEPSWEQINRGEVGAVSMSFDEVVADQLIKVDAIVNEAFGSLSDYSGTADEAVIEAALAKRSALAGVMPKKELQLTRCWSFNCRQKRRNSRLSTRRNSPK